MNNEIQVAEVQFFIYLKDEIALVLISLFSKPDPTLLSLLVKTLWSCQYQGDLALRFIDVKTIQAIVSMVPHIPSIQGQAEGECFFLVEKPGLDVAMMAGAKEMPGDEVGVVSNYPDTVG